MYFSRLALSLRLSLPRYQNVPYRSFQFHNQQKLMSSKVISPYHCSRQHQKSQTQSSSSLITHRSFFSSSGRPKQDHRDTSDPTTTTTLATLQSTLSTTIRLVKSSTASITSIFERISQTPHGRLMRLDKPTGTHLLFLPAAWTLTLGATSLPDWLHLTALFYGGSVLLRGAGCTVNDMWDADIDRQVTRTKNRPLASGEVSQSSAMLLLTGQLAGGLFILTKLNEASFPVAAIAVLPVLFYPLAKRLTTHPQSVLGLTFNAGTLLGYTASTGSLFALEPFLAYGAAWCWTMIYDTIYAHQDLNDDITAGVKSTAISFGDNAKLVMGGLAIGKIGLLTAVGMMSPALSCPYYVCVAAAGAHMARLIVVTDLNDKQQCQDAFNNSVTTGAIIWLGFILGRVF